MWPQGLGAPRLLEISPLEKKASDLTEPSGPSWEVHLQTGVGPSVPGYTASLGDWGNLREPIRGRPGHSRSLWEGFQLSIRRAAWRKWHPEEYCGLTQCFPPPTPQRSIASCPRSRLRTAQRTTSPPETTLWTSVCRPPPTDRNPTSCSAARTCDRPAPVPSARARPGPLPPHCPAPTLPPLCDWLPPSPRAPHEEPNQGKLGAPGCRTCSPWVPVGLSSLRGGEGGRRKGAGQRPGG